MKLKLWGVRGSIPSPGPQTMKYGGNTVCLELRFKAADRLIIIDAGSGIRELGNYMMSHDLPKGPIRTEIYLTHTHWDHIMGFLFFTPIYIPGTKIKIYAPVHYEDEPLENVMGGQLAYRYFPVRQAELASEIEYIDLRKVVLILAMELCSRRNISIIHFFALVIVLNMPEKFSAPPMIPNLFRISFAPTLMILPMMRSWPAMANRRLRNKTSW